MSEPFFREDMRYFNKGPTKPKRYTERIQVVVKPKMMSSINTLVDKGYFFNRSEFIRYLISKYLEENKKWIKELL